MLAESHRCGFTVTLGEAPTLGIRGVLSPRENAAVLQKVGNALPMPRSVGTDAERPPGLPV